MCNYKVRDATAVDPYLQRRENMDLMWPVFDDIAEQTFNLCFVEVTGCCQPLVELMATCQEKVMLKDNKGLLHALIGIKDCIDQLSHIFHKTISVNPNAGENFTNPVVWGARYAKWAAPLSTRVPMMSGLALPLFQLMDAFLGRVKYDSFIGSESFHVRSWLPMNVRAFIAAIEYHYPIHAYIKASGDHCLKGVLHGIVESYAGERGFMGTHRYKVYGFLEIAAKTGRAGTNGNPEAGKTGTLWQETHQLLSNSMKERLEPYNQDLTVEPHEMRGSFEECRFSSRILKRSHIDRDPVRSTGMVTFDLAKTGITFQPGDRLAVMPLNSQSEIEKVVSALSLRDILKQDVPLGSHKEWKRFATHLSKVEGETFSGTLTVYDILRRGHLAPLTKPVVAEVRRMLQTPSDIIEKVSASDMWPVRGSLGDLLQLALPQAGAESTNGAFQLSDISWLLDLIPVEVPRTYSISSFSRELLPSTIDLTVARSSFKISSVIDQSESVQGRGVSSDFLNPDPVINSLNHDAGEAEPVLIGISQPLNFHLPDSHSTPVVMFAGGSGIAPFRGFWQARAQGAGRNILFLGVQSREKFLYEEEIRNYARHGKLEVHVAFSRDTNGLQYNPSTKEMDEKHTEPRRIDAAIVEYGRTVYEMIMPKKQGGLGGHLYVCGSVSLYETVMSGLKRAMYNNQNVTKAQAEELVATAFAERRFMLDIFMTPQQISEKQEVISIAQLARNTGHKPDARMWIGVHGAVYDITDFLPLHPGGSLIVAASGGIDASRTFDDLAHTNNPEVASLLTKYFIGNLAPAPKFVDADISGLYDSWSQYLRTSVELLTTLGLEVQDLLESSSLWVSGGMLDSGGIRKFYQFQSRLLKSGISILFGTQLQAIYLQISYVIASKGAKGTRMPDVLGTVERAQASASCDRVAKEVAQIGKWICSNHEVQYHIKSLLRYAQAVTKIDLEFLESLRDYCATGLEAFDSIKEKDNGDDKQDHAQLASFLVSVLHRLAARLDTFYQTTAMEQLLRPEHELNPARTRWNILRSKIHDGSFFILCEPLEMGAESHHYRSWSQILNNVKFKEVISRAKETIATEANAKKMEEHIQHISRPRGLAAAYIARASNSEGSSFEAQIHEDTMQRLSLLMKNHPQLTVP
nr:sulfite reductase flavoprotein alpha-component [Colletotrichum truncatum]KAF6781801.1 sulfite reductase flavoprotein alpha-component [Colletotrichum truncatum]